MMILTLRAYQIDEYVEHVIAKKFSKSLEDVKAIIHEILQDDIQENGRPSKRRVLTRSEFSGVREKLRTLAERILLHPLVTSATRYEQSLLKSELRGYLLAHIAQIEDSEQYFTKEIVPNGSFHTWVRTTGSSHVFVTFSLAYLQCLVKPSSNRPVTAEELYIIHDIWTHLAKKVRMENDRPSLQRDRKEKNLNSLDFPEFPEDASVAKNQITNIILYEKRRCDMAFKELEEKIGNGHQVLDVLRFYYVLTDVCGDVYTLRDISTKA
ncbi:hypothetical protein B0O99DRAFT_617949 [Bisporella sp. PMI_857]|nr:hypothetical protein B0O99DRAFT_617949 [Bisporella sp. PMI_857]